MEVRIRRDAESDLQPVSKDNRFPVETVTAIQPINGNVGQVTVTTAATLIKRANANRRLITIANKTGTDVVYIGFDKGLTTANGHWALAAGVGASIDLDVTVDIYAIVATVSQTVSFLESEALQGAV